MITTMTGPTMAIQKMTKITSSVRIVDIRRTVLQAYGCALEEAFWWLSIRLQATINIQPLLVALPSFRGGRNPPLHKIYRKRGYWKYRAKPEGCGAEPNCSYSCHHVRFQSLDDVQVAMYMIVGPGHKKEYRCLPSSRRQRTRLTATSRLWNAPRQLHSQTPSLFAHDHSSRNV